MQASVTWGSRWTECRFPGSWGCREKESWERWSYHTTGLAKQIFHRLVFSSTLFTHPSRSLRKLPAYLLGSGINMVQGPFLTHLSSPSGAGLITTCTNEQRRAVLAIDLLSNQGGLHARPPGGTKGSGAHDARLLTCSRNDTHAHRPYTQPHHDLDLKLEFHHFEW